MDKDQVLAWFGRRGARRIVEGMARYGIYTDLRVFGVSMGTLLSLAKRIGKDHALATALWESGWYEALDTIASRAARSSPDTKTTSPRARRLRQRSALGHSSTNSRRQTKSRERQ